MRMTDENQFLFWPVWVEPKPQVRKINSPLAKLKLKRWHGAKLLMLWRDAKVGRRYPQGEAVGRFNSLLLRRPSAKSFVSEKVNLA